MTSRPPDRLYHGSAYYPELWPDDQIARDIAAMQQLGLNVARIGEFAWSKMEPDEGAIDLSYFARVMDQLHAAHIRVVLCTPTPTPPIWLSHGHPERMHVDATGAVMIHGARQHACIEHPDVRRYSYRIVEALARALGRHPALVAWQVDNEFKCHVAEDFNPVTIARWHAWLEKTYGTVARLNDAWGTEIWSQRYQRFDQVPAPLKTPFIHSASLATAYRMFSREMVAEFMDEQCAIIRRHSAAPITHNFNVGFAVNFERMGAGLDFMAWDDYPSAPEWPRIVFQSDLFRAAKPGRPFWVMETSVAHNGWLTFHEPTHPPGFLRAEAVAAYALGGAAFNYWLWRQQRTGCELPHSAVLQSWGTPSLGYQEVVTVEAARRALEPLLTTSVPAPAEIAVTWSDRGRAMLLTEPLGGRPGNPIDYQAILASWHRRLVDLGYHRDVRFEGAALDGLKLLITPAMPAVDNAFLARVRPWIESGGTWIIAPLTGTRTTEHTSQTEAGLGALESLAGVECVFGFPITQTSAHGEAFGLSANLAGWCTALRASAPNTKTIGTIHGALAPGLAFLTERPLGRGSVVVLGAQPDGDDGAKLLDQLVSHYATRAGIKPTLPATPGILVVPRHTTNGKALTIILDFAGQGGEATVPSDTTDALTGQAIPAGTLRIDPYGYRVLHLNFNR